VPVGTADQRSVTHDVERVRRLEAIGAVIAEITRELDLGTVLDLIVRRAVELVGAANGRVWLWDEDEQVLRPRASTAGDISMSDVSVRRGESVVGIVAERGEGLIENNYPTSTLAHPLLRARTTCTAIIAEPLLYRRRVVGVITAYHETRGRSFGEDHRAVLTLFAAHAAIAIENARLFEETTRRGQGFRALLDATKRLAHGLDAATALPLIAEEAARLLKVDNAGFRLLEGDELVLAGLAGTARETMLRPRLKIGESLSGIVVKTGRPLIVDQERDTDIAAQLVPGHRAADRRLGYRYYLGVPLRIGERTIGALAFRARRPFTPRDQELAEAFAAQAAVTIEQSRLFAATAAQAVALKAKNAELDSFVYSVSHDLKSPLVSIEGLAGVLLDEQGHALDANGRHLLERIQANAQHLERLTGDLLALSRIGREARPVEAVDLAAVVDAVLEELAGPIQERGIDIARSELATIRAIRAQVEQVIRNLVGNAVKYLGDTPAPCVEIQTIERANEVECIVRDNGIGIDPAYHGKIFEMFQRLNDVDAPGTGLGLPIVKKIVETAGGRIWVESARGEGAAFHFTWPGHGRQGAHDGIRE
jgi:signal transduction histidine kinase